MKKIIILASIALCSMLVKAQIVQTKTEKINDETTRTYSFYKNEAGEEVRHGKLIRMSTKLIIGWIVLTRTAYYMVN